MSGSGGNHKTLLGVLGGQIDRLQAYHYALTRLLSGNNRNCHLTRWYLFLQDFKFTPKYRPGVQHTNADGLSRQCCSQKVEPQADEGTSNLEGGNMESHRPATSCRTTPPTKCRLNSAQLLLQYELPLCSPSIWGFFLSLLD